MKRAASTLLLLLSFGLPTMALAQSAGTAPAPTTTTTAQPRPTLTAAQAQPAAAAPTTDPSNPNVIVLPPVNTVLTLATDPPASLPLPPWVPAVAGFVAGVLALLGVQAVQKNAARKNSKPCSCCNGTGKESACDTCSNCSGTGMVDDSQDLTLPCKPCGESGERPCGACDGEFEMEGASCYACARTGKELDEEGEPVECPLCKGEGELAPSLTRQVPCPQCQ